MGTLINLTGQKFGDLVVIKLSDVIKANQRTWECLCSCGEIRYNRGWELTNKKVQSCGNCKQKSTRFQKRQFINHLIGKKFGMLTVVEEAGQYITPSDPTKTNTLWKVVCDCDLTKHKVMKGSQLTSVKRGVTSCGCVNYATIQSAEHSAHMAIWRYNLKNAINRKLEFKLTFEELKNLITKKCHYCNIDGFYYYKKQYKKLSSKGFKLNGIDRVDNNLGYLNSNCVTCCKFCNNIKNKYSVEEFEEWLKNIKIQNLRKEFSSNVP